MITILNLFLTFSANNIIFLYEDLQTNKNTVKTMQKEICDAAGDMRCFFFKCKQDPQKLTNYFKFFFEIFKQTNTLHEDQNMKVKYLKNKINEGDDDNLFNLFMNLLINYDDSNSINHAFDTEDIKSDNILLNIKYIQNFASVDSEIFLFSDQELSKNELIYILREYKLRDNSKILKNEQLFVFVLRHLIDENNVEHFDYNDDLKKKFEKNMQNFEEALILYNRKQNFFGSADWEKIFSYLKYTKKSKLLFFSEVIQDFNQFTLNFRTDYSLHNLYFDFFLDSTYYQNLENEEYEKIEKFLEKDLLNELHVLTFDFTFGNSLKMFLIVSRKK
ncbi:hypothetical protein GVAV_001078 [Gurleya vavrai]